jgi:Tetracyclin repressor-like, C-terminal domain
VGRALDTLIALTLFVVAHAASEVTTARVNDAAAAGSQDYVAALDEREFPLLARAARLSAGTDDGARFEFAVAAFLRGVAPATGS